MRDLRGRVVATCIGSFALGALALAGAALGAGATGLLIFAGIALLVVGLFLAVILRKDPFRASRRGRAEELASGHHLTFDVGHDERHEVDYRWDQVWGWVTVTVDGDLIIRKLVTFTVRLKRVDEFEVGDAEKHVVRVEKSRPLVASFARPQPLFAYIDGTPVGQRGDEASA